MREGLRRSVVVVRWLSGICLTMGGKASIERRVWNGVFLQLRYDLPADAT